MKKTLLLAGIPVETDILFEEELHTFAPFFTGEPPLASAAVPPEALAAVRHTYRPDATDPYIDYMELCQRISDALLPFGRTVFHSVAFVWRDRAWLLTAVSGTGKTTQYVLWKTLYSKDVRMLNGDKPILEFRADGGVTVHPSPWRGKEGMGQMLSAPLGGIILLRQSAENRIRRVSPAEAACAVWDQFLFGFRSTDDARTVARLEDALLRAVPVWLLENRGDEQSARLCHDTLMEETV